MSTLGSDIVYGLRGLIKRPGFTAAAVLSLALGIAANSTIFSLVNGLLLNAIDYPERDRLVILWKTPVDRPDNRQNASYQDFKAWHERSRSFDNVGTMYEVPLNIGATRDGGAPEQILAERFNPAMFQVLSVKPALGRLFTQEEDVIETPAPVMLISYNYWQTKFQGSPSAIGQNLLVDGVPTAVIGVMPQGFTFWDEEVAAWVPAGYSIAQVNSTASFLLVAAKLKSGVSMEQAQSEMSALSQQLAAELPDRNRNMRVRIQTMADAFYGDTRGPLFILQGVVGFVLLIACANVAGLLLARASSRQTEVAVRAALGAGRARIIRQMLTESLLLAFLGGLVGLVLAWIGLRVFAATVPAGFPRLATITLNGRVLLFTAAIWILTGFLFGLMPAIQASRSSLASALRESSRSVMTGGGRSRLRGTLVAGQIGLALILLIGAGLLINSFLRVQRTNLGVNPSGVLSFEFRFPQNQMMKLVSRYRGVGLWEIFPATASTFTRIHERLKAIPGVQSAAGSNRRPLSGAMGMPFLIEGRPAPPPASGNGERGQQQSAGYYAVTPGFFETMKIPIVRGRDFTDGDSAASLPVIVINQAFVRRYFPNEDPIGKRITLDFVPNEKAREIIGITGDTRTFRREKEMRPLFYVPHVQQSAQWQGPSWNARAGMTFLIRTSTNPLSTVAAVRSAVAEIDATKPVNDVKTVEQYLDEQVAYDRLFTVLLSIFGGIAIVLAAVGIYGVMAYMVSQRTQEIGIRMALGADRPAVVKMILRHAGLLTGIGLAIGLVGSLALTRLIADQLWEVTPTDPLTFTGVSLLLIVVAVAATLVPARRAVAVDPNIALRHE